MNRYNGLSKYQQEKIMRAFCIDLTAVQASQMLGLNRKTVNRYYGLFRAAIFAYQEAKKAAFTGTVEVDESYFGATRPRGSTVKLKRGRGTTKQPVFGIFERGGRVYTEIIPDTAKRTLQRVIRGQVDLESIIISDGWRGYNGLVDVGFDKHLRIKKKIGDETRHVRNGVHINGIESFWSFTKRRLAKFNGVKTNFHLHLKECEWRWNKDFDTMLQQLKKMMV
jgi:transposase-like protein